jgi:hypothetical protein
MIPQAIRATAARTHSMLRAGPCASRIDGLKRGARMTVFPFAPHATLFFFSKVARSHIILGCWKLFIDSQVSYLTE